MWRPLAPEDGRGPGGPPPPPGGRRGRLRWAPLAAAAVRMWPPILLAALAAALGPLLGGPRRAAAPARGLARLSAAGPPPPRLAVASIFAPHMVLQRGEATLLWGVASPGSGPVIVRYGAAEVRSSVDDATGHWEAKLPAMDARSEPSNLTIESTTSSLMLQDVVVGDVYLCAGGSQMQYDLPTVADALRKRGEPVDSQRQWAREHASSVRIVEVARAYRRLAQDNATLMIPWQRMDHHFRLEFGALCYFFGAEQVKSRPDVPVGLVVSAYPSTFAEQFAPPEALEECGVDISYTGKLNEWWSPKDPGVLWNSMIHPLTWLPVKAFLLEMRPTFASSTGCLLPALLRHWRSQWHNSGKDSDIRRHVFFTASTPRGLDSLLRTVSSSLYSLFDASRARQGFQEAHSCQKPSRRDFLVALDGVWEQRRGHPDGGVPAGLRPGDRARRPAPIGDRRVPAGAADGRGRHGRPLRPRQDYHTLALQGAGGPADGGHRRERHPREQQHGHERTPAPVRLGRARPWAVHAGAGVLAAAGGVRPGGRPEAHAGAAAQREPSHRPPAGLPGHLEGDRRSLGVARARLEGAGRALVLDVGTSSPPNATRAGEGRGEA
ncbi:unnamed protein product, partial [Prorocentrum cordatum]